MLTRFIHKRFISSLEAIPVDRAQYIATPLLSLLNSTNLFKSTHINITPHSVLYLLKTMLNEILITSLTFLLVPIHPLNYTQQFEAINHVQQEQLYE